MNIYLPGPSTILRFTISCGVELASPALTALGEHVGDADNIAHTARPLLSIPQSSGSLPRSSNTSTAYSAPRIRRSAPPLLPSRLSVYTHHIQETDSAPPESLTSAAILGTRPSSSSNVTLPPPRGLVGCRCLLQPLHHLLGRLPRQAHQLSLPCLPSGFFCS